MRSRKLVTSNGNYDLFINRDGDVLSLGDGKYGGNGHRGKTVHSPTIIPILKCITSVSVGSYHTVCLDNAGNVFSFGKNSFGQLGIGVDDTIDIYGNGVDFDYKHSPEREIPQKVNLPPCAQISCGNNFTVCLTEDGLVYIYYQYHLIPIVHIDYYQKHTNYY